MRPDALFTPARATRPDQSVAYHMKRDSIREDDMSRRIRNRVIDCMELVVVEATHPRLGPDSLVNWWEDWREAALGPPSASGLSSEELAATRVFDQAWQDLADGTGNPMPPAAELVHDPLWKAFVAAAQRALVVFSATGRLPEHAADA